MASSTHPHRTLNLPSGSIRALLALVVFGITMFLLVMDRPLDESLWLASVLVLGYYFASRQTRPEVDGDAPRSKPLGLPNGSVRVLLFVMYSAAATLLVMRWSISEKPIIQHEAFFPMLAIASFFLGRLFRIISHGILARAGHRLHRLMKDGQALVALGCVLCLILIFLVPVDVSQWAYLKKGTLSFILFYFGAR